MALEGDALEFANNLKKNLKQRGVDIDNFDQITLQKVLETEYEKQFTKKPSNPDELSGGVICLLNSIEKLCQKCYTYGISERDYKRNYKKIKNPNRAPYKQEGLSEETKKLAKAIYLYLVLEDINLKGSKLSIPAAVYFAANLCRDWRSDTDVIYSNWVANGVESAACVVPFFIWQKLKLFEGLTPDARSLLKDHFKSNRKNGH